MNSFEVLAEPTRRQILDLIRDEELSVSELVEIMGRTTGLDDPQAVAVTDGARILARGDLARQVPVAAEG